MKVEPEHCWKQIALMLIPPYLFFRLVKYWAWEVRRDRHP